MCQIDPVNLEKLSFSFLQVKIIQVLDFDNWHPLKLVVGTLPYPQLLQQLHYKYIYKQEIGKLMLQ